jgi:hypothetical protein
VGEDIVVVGVEAMVGIFKLAPAYIKLGLEILLALAKASTVVLFRLAIADRVSPGFIV